MKTEFLKQQISDVWVETDCSLLDQRLALGTLEGRSQLCFWDSFGIDMLTLVQLLALWVAQCPEPLLEGVSVLEALNAQPPILTLKVNGYLS